MSVEKDAPNLIERLDDLLQKYNDLLNMNFDKECFRSMKIQEWKYKEKISVLEAKLKLTKMKLKFETDLRIKSEEEREKIAKTLKLESMNESRKTTAFSTSEDNFITATNSFILTENDLNESHLLSSSFRKHQVSVQNSNWLGIFGPNPLNLTKIKSSDVSYPGLEMLREKSRLEANKSPKPSPINNDNVGSETTHFNRHSYPENHVPNKFIRSRCEILKITPTKNSSPLYFSPRKGSTPLHQNSSCVDSSLDRYNFIESNEHSISKLAPLIPPMIPMAVIHCIDEIERRGLKEIGVYRMAGDEEDIMNLHEKFENFGAEVNLSEINIHSIAAFLKSFLCNFPLIPKTFHNLFSRVIIENNREELYYAISELPQANRDTLAYFIIHLRRVSFAPLCKMPASRLSAVFGPIVFGLHTCEKENQCLDTPIYVMEELLKLPSSYWNSFIVDPTSSETPMKLRNSPSTEEIVRKKAKKFFSNNVRRKKFFTSP